MRSPNGRSLRTARSAAKDRRAARHWNRSRKVNHTWTLHKAYVHAYEELEFPALPAAQRTRALLQDHRARTLLHNNVDYDGKKTFWSPPENRP